MNVYLLDSNFLISLLDPQDKFQLSAQNIYDSLIVDSPLFVIPEIVLQETIFTLMKGNLRSDYAFSRIQSITMQPKVIISGADSLSMLRYSSGFYNHLALPIPTHQSKITKTSDYLIACIALDHNATVISNDNQMVKCLIANGVSCLNFVS